MNFDRHLRILGTGRYIPRRKVAAEELDRIMGIPPGTCYKTTGVQTRYWIDGETATEMGASASAQALERSGLKPSDLDVIVSTAGVNEQLIPTNACLISARLGLQDTSIPGFDVNSSCMSFLQGLDVLSYMIEHGRYETALICSSDITSCGINYQDIKSCPLFGDGASAMVVTRDDSSRSGIIASHIETYSKGARFSEIRGGGNRLPGCNCSEGNRDDFRYELHGTEMGKLVLTHTPGFFERAFQRINMTLQEVVDDVSVIVPHQVSPSLLRLLEKRLRFPHEKFLNITRDFGNMLSVSVPLGIDESIITGKLKRGQRILLFGGGSGISLGTMYLCY